MNTETVDIVDASYATIISICPFPIRETKPGLFPNAYSIKAAAPGDIEILNINDQVYFSQRVPVIGNVIQIPVPAKELAESIVSDRLTGQLLYSATSKPGLFWVPGKYSKQAAKIKFKAEIDEANIYQNQWYADLVKFGDDEWNQHHQHKFITDLQRHAARILGLEKEWLIEAVAAADVTKKCVACYSPIHINAVICAICRTDQEEFVAKRAKK